MNVEKKGRELVENLLNAPGGKISRFQAMNFAKLNIASVIKAIEITIDTATGVGGESCEWNNSLSFWNGVGDWIDSAIGDSVDSNCDYPDPVRYAHREFVYSYLGDYESWLASMSDSGFDVVQVLSTKDEPDFGISKNIQSVVLFKWRVV